MIKDYIRYRISIAIFYLGMIIFFPMVHYLYGFPMESVGYGVLLMSFMLILYLIIDFFNYRNKLSYLVKCNKHLTVDQPLLPRQINRIEKEYQSTITSLYHMLQHKIEGIERTNTEQLEYYTMWVHQIKTPISAMRLSLQGSPSTSQSEVLELELFKIEQYVELALQYIKMKDLSTDLVIRDYALEDIVNQSIKKYAPLFIYKKLTLQIQEFHKTITTDSKWLSFILEQLISNAIKYTNQGDITIKVTKKSLQITDTGIGIRAEDIERIFEKGYTGYNGRLDKKASGIGLYLAKKVADSLAIRLVITSKVGCGTTAEVIFPEDEKIIYKE